MIPVSDSAFSFLVFVYAIAFNPDQPVTHVDVFVDGGLQHSFKIEAAASGNFFEIVTEDAVIGKVEILDIDADFAVYNSDQEELRLTDLSAFRQAIAERAETVAIGEQEWKATFTSSAVYLRRAETFLAIR